MNNKLISGILVLALSAVIWTAAEAPYPEPEEPSRVEAGLKTICDTVEKGETLFKIFSKHDLQMKEVLSIKKATLEVHPVRKLQAGRPYRFELDEDGRVSSFQYWIDDDSLLDIRRGDEGFHARKEAIPYEKRTLVLEGTIEENLICSMGEGREHLSLALELSDIYAWDIDFTTDLQKGDSWRIVAEGMYLDGKFRKFGNILAAEFQSKGRKYKAYRYDGGGGQAYYDEEGNSLKKMFLKAPLSFRRISSYYSLRRYHPVLKIGRPHRGLDYAAARGTPVSSVGSGVVLFAGRRGQYGNFVVIRHPNNWTTCYGHLARISSSIRRGRAVEQGQVIGYVGSTGLATGPHLHFEVKHCGRNLDPLSVVFPGGGVIPKSEMQTFRRLRDQMDGQLASGSAAAVTAALREEKKSYGARL